uniref:Uncharacterized protein n=1 Tax=Sphaerodactylus townsendi TaxID=933632 RepID=A0ACB8E5U7_9SAUR
MRATFTKGASSDKVGVEGSFSCSAEVMNKQFLPDELILQKKGARLLLLLAARSDLDPHTILAMTGITVFQARCFLPRTILASQSAHAELHLPACFAHHTIWGS